MELQTVPLKCELCPAGNAFAYLCALEDELGSNDAKREFYNLDSQTKAKKHHQLNKALIEWTEILSTNRLHCPCHPQ